MSRKEIFMPVPWSQGRRFASISSLESGNEFSGWQTKGTKVVREGRKIESARALAAVLSAGICCGSMSSPSSSDSAAAPAEDLRELNRQLVESEQRLRLALETGRIGLWVWNSTDVSNAGDWSPRLKEIFGLPPGTEVTHDLFLKCVHPDDRERVNSEVMQAVGGANGGEYALEYRAIHTDGSVHWVTARGRAFFQPDGKPFRFLGTVMDITDRKQAEDVSHRAAVEAERLRFVRDMHDTLAQGFTGVIIQLEAAEDARLRGLPGEVEKHLNSARVLAKESLQEARRSVHALRPQALDGRTLCTALADMFRRLTEGTTIAADFAVEGEARELPPGWEDHLLRISQETFANTLRHADATQFRGRLVFGDNGLRLEFADNGRGFLLDGFHEGIGLQGIKERVAAMSGNVTISSEPAQGTKIFITLPCPLHSPR